MNKILITGVAGFIGSHLAKSLIEKGHDVIGVDIKDIAHNDMMGSLVVNSSFTYVKKDVRKVGVFDIIRWSPTHIVHLAAVPGGQSLEGRGSPIFQVQYRGVLLNDKLNILEQTQCQVHIRLIIVSV